MSGVEVLPEGSAGVASMLVLTVGLAALFLGQSWFWVVFVVGFAGVVPLVTVLSKDDEETKKASDTPHDGGETAGESRTEALETLRERYARGELNPRGVRAETGGADGDGVTRAGRAAGRPGARGGLTSAERI